MLYTDVYNILVIRYRFNIFLSNRGQNQHSPCKSALPASRLTIRMGTIGRNTLGRCLERLQTCVV